MTPSAEGLHRCLFYSFHSSGHHHKQNWFISGITAKVCISSYLKGLHFTQRYFNRKPNYFELYLSYREDLIVFFIYIPVQTWLLCLYSKSCFTNNLKSFCPFLWLSFSLWSKPCDFYYNKHSYHYYYTHLETISFLFHLYHFIFLLSMSDCHSVNLIIPSWAFTTPRSFLAPDWPTWGRWEIQTQVYQPNSLRNTVCQTRAHCLLRFWGKSQYNVISFILKVPFPLLLNVCMYIYTSESSFTGNVVEPMLCCAAPEKKKYFLMWTCKYFLTVRGKAVCWEPIAAFKDYNLNHQRNTAMHWCWARMDIWRFASKALKGKAEFL